MSSGFGGCLCYTLIGSKVFVLTCASRVGYLEKISQNSYQMMTFMDKVNHGE